MLGCCLAAGSLWVTRHASLGSKERTGFLPQGQLEVGRSGKEFGVTAPPCGNSRKQPFLLVVLKFPTWGSKETISGMGSPNTKPDTYLKSICYALCTTIIVLPCNDLIFPPFLLENILSKIKKIKEGLFSPLVPLTR